MPINPVHVALLSNGKVLVVAGSGNCPPSQAGCPSGPPYSSSNGSGALLVDPVSGQTISQFSLSWDMFCNGMVLLEDGRPFVVGGTIQYDPFFGQPQAATFDPLANTFSNTPNMAHGRWYPTVVTLGDGRVMAFSGLTETGGTNTAVEFYTDGSGWSTQYTASWTPDLYPRLHVLPNGKVFYSGSQTTSKLFDPSANTWNTNVAKTNYSGARTYGTSVLLPVGPSNNYDPKVIIMGGGNPATNTTEIIDMGASTSAWQLGPNMSQARIEMNAVILPNGKVLAVGGSLNDEDTNTASLNADLYDPVTNTFSSAGANAYPRLYHSVALLLPDATVWLAGGNPSRGSYVQQMEIYKPAYLFNPDGTMATRPSITSAPSTISYGEAFTVATSDAANISSAVLVRNGTVTHAFGMDQREVGLSFTVGSGILTVTAPPSGNIAPPGYYMLFLLNQSGVPSVASFVQVTAGPQDFSVAATPSSQNVSPGNGISYTVSVIPSNGFTGNVSFTVTGLPSGATASFTPSSVSDSGSSTLTVNTSTSTPTGNYTLTITATSGTLIHSTQVSLAVGTPTVSSVSPNNGPTTGGTAVTVTGTNFAAGATLTFGSAAATNVVVVNSTTITAVTPAHALGEANITVTNTDGQSATLVGNTSPLSNAGFESGAANWVLSASGGTATFASNAANAHSGSGYVELSAPAGSHPVLFAATASNVAEYFPVSPGDVITFGGWGYNVSGNGNARWGIEISDANKANASYVSAAPYNVTTSSWVNFQSTYTVPTGKAFVRFYCEINSSTVTAVDRFDDAYLQIGIVNGGFDYIVATNPAPTLSSITPRSGSAAGGTSVSISGANFLAGAKVSFDSDAATNVVVVNSTTITAVTPAHVLGEANVTVTNTDGQSATLVGNTSPLSNAGFESGAVNWVLSGSGGTATFPSNAANAHSGSGYVELSAPAGTHPVLFAATASNVAEYFPVSPGDIVAFGGWGYNVSGNGLARWGIEVSDTNKANAVYVSAPPYNVTTSSWVNFQGAYTVPTGKAFVRFYCEINSPTVAAVDRFDDAYLQIGIPNGGFDYLAPGTGPVVNSVSPTQGVSTGGDTVTISGSNFAAGATVAFGGAAATNVMVVNSTTITATTPAGSAGAATVTVTNPDGQSGSLTSGFTYIASPTVSSVSPNSGSAAGGTVVTITGTNFATGATVTFGSASATNVTVANSTTITATTPAGSGGAVTVTVTNSGGQSGSLTNGFTYTAPPTVSSVSPNSGSTSGGTPVIITGTNFVTGATVTFGSASATNVTVANGTTITATTPAGSAGAVTVTVTNSSGQSGSLANGYTYVVSPTVSSVSPNSGSTSGGTPVTITGTNFVTGATVTFGSASATNVTVANSTTITATTPAGSGGAVTVTVTNSGGQSGSLTNGFTYTAPPTVSSVSPNSGSTSGGTPVTITGTNFAAGATVTFGSASATNVTVANGTTITATTPAGSAGAVTVTVTNSSGQSGSLANGYTYVVSPTVSSVSPNSGSTSGGTPVTITGTNFVTGATVTFGSASATNVTVANGTTITATTPAESAGAVTVTVTNSGGQSGSLTNGFTYTAPPTVSSVSPNSGSTSGGTPVTITGTNFAAGATVTFGGASATNVTVANGTTITATTPAGSAGAVTVTVTNSSGQSGSLANGYTYVVSPTVSSVSPNSGSAAGGTVVTITGTNFATGATVTFGSASATNVTVANSTTITATTPAGSGGAVTVTVTNSGGQSGSLTNGFTYTAPPTVSSVSPNSGSTSGGTPVIITGTNFVTGATVTFGSASATNVTVANGTTITATTPAGSAGAVTVTVTNSSGQSGSLANGYTYVVSPTVSSVSPNSGPVAGGTSVTITGTNFVTGATVTFGSTAATNVVVVNGTTITATTPAGSAGAVTVTVTANGQSGSLASAFTYIGQPTVTSVSPNNGPVAGGTAVTITGTNFASGATVTFGSAAATSVAVVNSTTITAKTPAGSAGAVTVTVTNSGGLSGNLASGFTYNASVAISFAQVASATPQSPTATVSVSYPGAQTSGDLNIVVVGWNDTTTTVQSVKDSAGNTYKLAIGPTSGTALQQSIYYAADIVSGGNTVTVAFSAAAAFPDVRILEYRGVTAVDVTAGTSGNSASASSGAATTTGANELIFGANTVATTTGAAGSGFTSRVITPDGDIAEDKVVTAAGNNSATATLTSAGPWVMQMVTFK